jgi:hypothetical protein
MIEDRQQFQGDIGKNHTVTKAGIQIGTTIFTVRIIEIGDPAWPTSSFMVPLTSARVTQSR